MQNIVRRYSAVLMSALLMLAVSIPAYAEGEDYTSRSSFFSWASRSNDIVAKILGHLPVFNMTACPNSADGQHHSDSYFEDRANGYYTSVCVHCGKTFTAHASDLSAAYDNYVETLPAQGYVSSGKLIWQPTFSDFDPTSKLYFSSNSSLYFRDLPFDKVLSSGNGRVFSSPSATYLTVVCSVPWSFDVRFQGCTVSAPVEGSYIVLEESPFVSGNLRSDHLEVFGSVSSSKAKPVVDVYSDGKIKFGYMNSSLVSPSFLSGASYIHFPIFEIVPYSVSGDTYNINTRPTSITGGNYGIVGDNGQITKVEDNSTIINETNNTFYNPATGTTVPIVNWSYDYSDRSYKVTLESGDTATVTYGDENITISQITTTEGDTITNNYTIYYLVDGSGSVTPPCDHAWTETNTTPATCTVPGSKLSTCSKCQQTKKDPIPALGHDWQVKQTVTTEYDDTGQLIQQGYTIFECSRCHEQYKSSDGTIPPGGGSGTDPGGDEGETIWDKLGNLIGAIGSGVIGLIEAALGKVLDALIALMEGMMERLKTVVEAVLSIFDELPKLFGGFLDFLVAVFPFLPPELMTILTFGILAVVFIGIIKAVRR